MQIIYSPKAKEHLDYWVESGNIIILKKILQLSKAIIENPYEGIGKPEPLKHELAGYWSRRITKEHRYVYAVTEDLLIVVSLKGHY